MFENKFWTSYEPLESIGEMKLMMKFYLLNFEIYFLEFSSELFLVLFQATIYIFNSTKM